MPGDRKLDIMHQAFADLENDEARRLAMHWMIGALSMHVTDEQWNQFVIDAVRMANHGRKPKVEEVPIRSGKDAAAGPDK